MTENNEMKEGIVPFGYHFAEPAFDLEEDSSATLSRFSIQKSSDSDRSIDATKRKTDKFDLLPWVE